MKFHRNDLIFDFGHWLIRRFKNISSDITILPHTEAEELEKDKKRQNRNLLIYIYDTGNGTCPHRLINRITRLANICSALFYYWWLWILSVNCFMRQSSQDCSCKRVQETDRDRSSSLPFDLLLDTAHCIHTFIYTWYNLHIYLST